ncbi:hypothetical protein D3C81_921890 [compost metagenome]
MSHFVENQGHGRRIAGGMPIVPGQPEPRGQLAQDPQVLACLPGRVDRLPAQLHRAVRIGEGASLLGEGRGGQHHIGQAGGLGQENVLHHQMVERGQRLARVLRIRVRHRRVLAHDVHAAHGACLDGLHDLHHGQARLLVQRHAPQRLEGGVGGRVIHAPVVRIHHRDQPRVGRALHVVLAAQRMQTRARPADLARHQRQRDQAARVVRAMHVLGHAHAPQDHRSLRGGVEPGHLADGFRVDAADRGHELRAVRGHIGRQRLVAGRARGNEFGIDKPFLHNHMHHRVQQCHVGIGLELQEPVRKARQVRSTRIGDDELGTVAHRVLDPGGCHRMVDRGIGADQQHHLGLAHVHHRIGHRPRADSFEQRRHR